MIIGDQARIGALSAPSAYVVTSNAEWNAVLANDAATLAGKVIELVGSGFTQLTIADRDMAAHGAPLIIRSRDSDAKIPSILLNGVTRGIDFAGVNFQMTGWPHDFGACLVLNNGTFGQLRFLSGTSFRHGYGANLADIDTAAELPEYHRRDNIQTATTISTRHPLAWQDSAAPSGWIEFFNRGSEAVHIAIGGADISASSGDTLCPAGGRVRISGLVPATATHFAILALAGTSVVNARAEIGLAEYLAQPFQQSGAAVLEDIEFRNCFFRDLAHGVKGFRPTGTATIMDCDFDRIYQDIIALAPTATGSLHILRNLECLPFARSGIAEHLAGDARDPHGDQFQLFGSGSATIGPVYYAGNRIRTGRLRDGVSSQGIFVSDNDIDPSYTELYFISTMQVGGSGRGLSLGEAGTSFKVRDAFVYGASIVNWRDANDDAQFLTIDHDGAGTVYVGNSIAPSFTATAAEMALDGTLALTDASNPAAVFPGLGQLTSASSRSEIEAAMTTAGPGLGVGAIASAGTIDWETADPRQVIGWERLPSGAHWNGLTNQAPAAVIELPPRRILNRHAVQAVSAAAGTQWRKLAADGATELQPWTSLPGTIAPGQFIQIRCSTSDIAGGSTTAAITINGFTQSVPVATSQERTAFLVQGNPIGYFVDPANVPAGTTRITFAGSFFFPASVPNAVKPFVQSSTGCDLSFLSDGSLTATVEDGGGANLLLNARVAPPGTVSAGRWHRIVFDVDQTAAQVRINVDGTTTTTAFAKSGNGVFQSNRAIAFLAGTTGLTPLPPGTRIADLSVEFNGATHKVISNIAASANSDPWRRGGQLADG